MGIHTKRLFFIFRIKIHLLVAGFIAISSCLKLNKEHRKSVVITEITMSEQIHYKLKSTIVDKGYLEPRRKNSGGG